MCNTHICSQHKHFHYRLKYTSRRRVYRCARFYLPAGRSRVYRLTRIPSSSLKFRSAFAYPPSFLPHYLPVSVASSNASRTRLRSTEISVYHGVGRREIIPLTEGHLKSTYMISQIIHLHDFNERTRCSVIFLYQRSNDFK